MNGHTDGPWERRSIPGHLFEINNAQGETVFRIRGGMNPMLADAKLISAAPDLLAALKQAYSDLQRFAPTSTGSDMARAAIAKAQS